MPFFCFLVAVCLSLTNQSHTCSARLASTRWWWAPRQGSFTQIREVALLWLSGFHILAKYILSVAPHNAKVQRSNSCRGHRGHCGDQQRSSRCEWDRQSIQVRTFQLQKWGQRRCQCAVAAFAGLIYTCGITGSEGFSYDGNV